MIDKLIESRNYWMNKDSPSTDEELHAYINIDEYIDYCNNRDDHDSPVPMGATFIFGMHIHFSDEPTHVKLCINGKYITPAHMEQEAI